MRSRRALSLRLPGLIAPILMAASRSSSRRLALRAALSGPWQAKQFSARIGRTSRLYSILAWAQSGKEGVKKATPEARQERVVIASPIMNWAVGGWAIGSEVILSGGRRDENGKILAT